MTKEMVEKKSHTLKEYKKITEELKIENANLKNQLSQKDHDKEILEKKISDLDSKIKTLNEIVKSIEGDYSKLEHQNDSLKSNLEQEKKQETESSSKKIAEIRGKKVKKEKKKEDSEVTEELKQVGRISAKKIIVEGTSRRKCPVCGNSNIKLIREVVDKTIILLDYPKVYGKKLTCLECGGEWRVSSEK